MVLRGVHPPDVNGLLAFGFLGKDGEKKININKN